MAVAKTDARDFFYCDGCGRKMQNGEPMVGDCAARLWGSCTWRICIACVERAAILLGLIVKEEKT